MSNFVRNSRFRKITFAATMALSVGLFSLATIQPTEARGGGGGGGGHGGGGGGHGGGHGGGFGGGFGSAGAHGSGGAAGTRGNGGGHDFGNQGSNGDGFGGFRSEFFGDDYDYGGCQSPIYDYRYHRPYIDNPC